MKIKQYDSVKLKDGRMAVVVEIFDKCYIADIAAEDDWETDFIYPEQIEQVITGGSATP